jgi:8-oxo-dGTP diphosphatase
MLNVTRVSARHLSYPEKRMNVAVDIVIFTVQERALKVLLVKRGIPPFKDQLAIPGGFVLPDEDLDEAALRELREETGVSDVYLEQLYSFGDPKRDPRDRVISIAYFALISADRTLKAGTDASEASWWLVRRTPKLAFDHAKILKYALDRLRNKLEYTTVGFQLLPPKFTLGELQGVYEAILEKRLDKRNFRRKIAELKILKPLSKEYRNDVGRPAQLFQFVAGRSAKRAVSKKGQKQC